MWSYNKYTVVSLLSHQSRSSTVVRFPYCRSPHKKCMYDLACVVLPYGHLCCLLESTDMLPKSRPA